MVQVIYFSRNNYGPTSLAAMKLQWNTQNFSILVNGNLKSTINLSLSVLQDH